jgi:DNA-binding MarR family transcriptional regulator
VVRKAAVKAEHTQRRTDEEPAPRPAIASGEGAVERTSDLDRLIHERLRLGIISALVVNEGLSFTELKGLLNTSDGNLSVHARKLEDAGYIACQKGFEGRVPRTEFRITPKGRKALKSYLDHMEALIAATRIPR